MRFASDEVIEHLAEVWLDRCSPGTDHLIFLLGTLLEDVEAVTALLHDERVDFVRYFVEKRVFTRAERIQSLVHNSNKRTQEGRD